MAPDTQSLTDLFARVSSYEAEGYATGFHAGIAAVQREIGRHLLSIRHDPIRLRQALLDMTVQPGETPQLTECHPARGQVTVI